MDMLLRQTAEKYSGDFREFAPFPRAGHPDGYETLSPDLRKRILEEGESFLGYRYPAIYATNFMNFQRTGNRVLYEDLYFARRHALCALVTAECVERKGRFTADIVNGIFILCEESGWQLPPHNSYHRDSPQLLLPDSSRPVLDLFACETGALLACVSYLLGEKLDELSPLITARIHRELNRRIIIPYLEEHFWWMGQGDEPMCNWTAWCTQNVLITAFSEPFDPDIRRRIFLKAAQSLDFFLKDYGEDGCCDEGAQYYRHAGLCLCNAMEVLNAVSDGAFSPLFQTEKIRNIAAYILHVHVADKYYFNFSDCSPIAGRAGVQEYLFGKYTCQPELMAFAARDFRASGGELYSDEVNRISLYHRFQNIVYWKEVYAFGNCGDAPERSDAGLFYPSVGLFLARSDTLALAVKAGDNADNHNHNDTGSFTLYKNGRPLFVDIGVESYTGKTFSSRRYEIWTMQSGYHNLPTLMGADQSAGEKYRATEVETSFGSRASISMELINAYPLTGHDKTGGAPLSYRRRVTLDKKEGKVTVEDTSNLPDVILNFITYEKPVLREGQFLLGDLARASFTGALPLSAADSQTGSAVEVLPITDARLKKAWDHNLYRVRLRMTGGAFTLEIQ